MVNLAKSLQFTAKNRKINWQFSGDFSDFEVKTSLWHLTGKLGCWISDLWLILNICFGYVFVLVKYLAVNVPLSVLLSSPFFRLDQFFLISKKKKVSKVLCASSVCSLWVIICDQSGRFSSALEKKLQKVVNFGKISLFSSVKGVVTLLLFK